MPLSTLLITILEQAKEPLHCLHGAGYFTPEEWMQLDLIMNKEYTWTTGPSSLLQLNVIKSVDLEQESKFSLAGAVKDISISDAISLSTSIEPTISDINTSPITADGDWKNSLETVSSKLFEPLMPTQCEPKPLIFDKERPSTVSKNRKPQEFKDLQQSLKEKIPKISTSAENSDGKSDHSSAQQLKSNSSCTSEVHCNPHQSLKICPLLKVSPTPIQPKQKSSRSSKSTNVNHSKKRLGDVNSFETKNATEWDDVNRKMNRNSSRRNEISTLIEKKIEKIANIIAQENQMKGNNHQASFSSRVTTRSSNRVLEMPRLTRHRESKDRKTPDENDAVPQQKTRVCWFWAESPGGCRYKPEECLNLHVKPSPNAILRQSLADGRLIRGSSMNSETYVGKPLTCWSWASTGTCDKGDKCKDVHGWIIGGIAPADEARTFGEIPDKFVQIEDETILSTTEKSKEEKGNLDLVDLGTNDLKTNNCEKGDPIPSPAADFNPVLMESQNQMME
ncbi:hypothetical protein GcM1_224077 [Golovinomyces cichoracearum]|uniref:C3H1-type domain-containing protein n=1 Tax=Golovinomyces cichoracearum TaxID=62708 RepID=A0A420IQM4_9PEZI|nr:hypothetical protein GcM1_224077 [Golovinomyces cichoracearum]